VNNLTSAEIWLICILDMSYYIIYVSWCKNVYLNVHFSEINYLNIISEYFVYTLYMTWVNSALLQGKSITGDEYVLGWTIITLDRHKCYLWLVMKGMTMSFHCYYIFVCLYIYFPKDFVISIYFHWASQFLFDMLWILNGVLEHFQRSCRIVSSYQDTAFWDLNNVSEEPAVSVCGLKVDIAGFSSTLPALKVT
jgi:hypothetical protein